MNLADVLIMLLLCGGAMLGFYHGLVRTVFHMLLLYFVTIIAAFAYPTVARGLAYVMPGTSLQMREVISFLFILLFFFNLIFFSTRATFKSRGPFLPAMLDKLGGMVAGFFMAALWIAVGLLVLDFILSLHWLQWQAVRDNLAVTFATSPLAQLVESLLPYALATLRPWFAPFGGLPRIFTIQ